MYALIAIWRGPSAGMMFRLPAPIVQKGSENPWTLPESGKPQIVRSTAMNPQKPTVAILGASHDRNKFGNKSVRAHLQQGYEVFPVNPNAEEVEGLRAYPSLDAVPVEHLDRISIYVPPQIGLTLLEDIQRKGAKEVWFNPGSDSDEVIARAHELGINVIQACSIVDVGVSPSTL